MPRPHRHSLSAPRRHDRRWPRRQIRRRLPCRRPLTLPDNRRRRSASPRPPLNEVHQSIAKLGATSTSRFPRPLQNTGSATRKDIKIRASNHIRKRGHAHRARQLLKARILLKADASEAGEGWSASQIASALDTTVATVARTCQRLVEEGFEAALILGQTAHLRRRGRGQADCPGLFQTTQGAQAVDAAAAGNGGGGTEYR